MIYVGECLAMFSSRSFIVFGLYCLSPYTMLYVNDFSIKLGKTYALFLLGNRCL